MRTLQQNSALIRPSLEFLVGLPGLSCPGLFLLMLNHLDLDLCDLLALVKSCQQDSTGIFDAK